MARRIIKRRKTQKRRRTRQRGGACNPEFDCDDCPVGQIKNLCLQRRNAEDGPYRGTRSRNGGGSRRRRIKRKGTKRRKP